MLLRLLGCYCLPYTLQLLLLLQERVHQTQWSLLQPATGASAGDEDDVPLQQADSPSKRQRAAAAAGGVKQLAGGSGIRVASRRAPPAVSPLDSASFYTPFPATFTPIQAPFMGSSAAVDSVPTPAQPLFTAGT